MGSVSFTFFARFHFGCLCGTVMLGLSGSRWGGAVCFGKVFRRLGIGGLSNRYGMRNNQGIMVRVPFIHAWFSAQQSWSRVVDELLSR